MRPHLFWLAFLPAFASAAAGASLDKEALDVSVVVIDEAGWPSSLVRSMLDGAAPLFRQCGIELRQASVHRVAVPERLRYFTAETAEAVVGEHFYKKPAVYLMRDTRRRIPFDAETFAPGNSARHPRLVDTIWMMRGTRDPAIALAHELVHLLANSGEHSQEPGNLMRDETAPGNTHLTADQCRAMRASGSARGLLVKPE